MSINQEENRVAKMSGKQNFTINPSIRMKSCRDYGVKPELSSWAEKRQQNH